MGTKRPLSQKRGGSWPILGPHRLPCEATFVTPGGECLLTCTAEGFPQPLARITIAAILLFSALAGCADRHEEGQEGGASPLPDRSSVMDPAVEFSALPFANQSTAIPYTFELNCPGEFDVPTNVSVRRPSPTEVGVTLQATVPRPQVSSEWVRVNLTASAEPTLPLHIREPFNGTAFIVFKLDAAVEGAVVHPFSIRCA